LRYPEEAWNTKSAQLASLATPDQMGFVLPAAGGVPLELVALGADLLDVDVDGALLGWFGFSHGYLLFSSLIATFLERL
jgi:hypothetical protein